MWVLGLGIWLVVSLVGDNLSNMDVDINVEGAVDGNSSTNINMHTWDKSVSGN
jgi:hypothetical protein